MTQGSWLVDTPRFTQELLEGNPGAGVLAVPMNIFRGLLAEVATRATELNDPALNVLMLRLNLYDVPHGEVNTRIKEQEARAKGAADFQAAIIADRERNEA